VAHTSTPCLQVKDTWSVAGRMGEVPGPYIAAALVPAVIIAVLFYFDHNVSSQMAQQPEFNLVKGPAYHWDFLLLSGLVGAAVDGRVLGRASWQALWLTCLGLDFVNAT
jgi:hypothetical protein